MPKKSDNLTQMESTDEILELNLGPQHPSTHGVLRLKLRLDGEVVVSAEPIVGYLPRGVEKERESRPHPQVAPLVERPGYLSGPSEEQAFAASVERLMGI